MRHRFSQTIGWLLCLTFVLLSAQAVAQDEKGMLRVRSDQGTATLYVGTQVVGETPYSAYVASGTYTIRVLLDGFEPFVRRIQVQPGQATDVTARLFPGKGSVEFLVEPKGTKLTLKGSKETWPTPVRLRDLDPGDYEYTLTAPNHETETGAFSFETGQNLLISTRLHSSAGMIAVISQPEGAAVLLDGEDVGVTPLHLEDIPGGPHTVQLAKRGYASVFRQFDTTDGSKGVVEARLPRSGVPLSVATGNPDSELIIEGVRLGPQPTYRFGPVERGRYQLTISAPDKKTVEQSISVPVTGTALYRAKLRDSEGTKPSTLTRNPPFYKHWLFWTAVGSGAAGGTAAVLYAMRGTQTTPIKSGDILIHLP